MAESSPQYQKSLFDEEFHLHEADKNEDKEPSLFETAVGKTKELANEVREAVSSVTHRLRRKPNEKKEGDEHAAEEEHHRTQPHCYTVGDEMFNVVQSTEEDEERDSNALSGLGSTAFSLFHTTRHLHSS